MMTWRPLLQEVSEWARRFGGRPTPPRKGKKKETGSDEFRGAGGAAAGGAMRSTHLECKAEAGIMGPPQSGRAAGSAPPLSVHHWLPVANLRWDGDMDKHQRESNVAGSFWDLVNLSICEEVLGGQPAVQEWSSFNLLMFYFLLVIPLLM
jgi:hypothetical protein